MTDINTEETPIDEQIFHAVAQGWCTPETEHKQMDVVLAIAIAEKVTSLLDNNLSPCGTAA